MEMGFAQALEPSRNRIATDKKRRTLFTESSNNKFEFGETALPAPLAGTKRKVTGSRSEEIHAESITIRFDGVTDAHPTRGVS